MHAFLLCRGTDFGTNLCVFFGFDPEIRGTLVSCSFNTICEASHLRVLLLILELLQRTRSSIATARKHVWRNVPMNILKFEVNLDIPMDCGSKLLTTLETTNS